MRPKTVSKLHAVLEGGYGIRTGHDSDLAASAKEMQTSHMMQPTANLASNLLLPSSLLHLGASRRLAASLQPRLLESGPILPMAAFSHVSTINLSKAVPSPEDLFQLTQTLRFALHLCASRTSFNLYCVSK